MSKQINSAKENLRFLDLFAGAGGLSEGFISAGFQPVAHVEMNSSACYTLKTRMARHWLYQNSQKEKYINYLDRKISRDELYKEIPENILSSVINNEIGANTIKKIFKTIDEIVGDKKINLIIGGPPCQAYSLIGRSSVSNKMKNDQRNYLFKYYALFLEKYKPSYFVFENVIGLLSAKDENEKLYLDLMKDSFRKAGYEIEYKTLCASDYGVLQKRRRIILVGKRDGEKGFYPEPVTDLNQNVQVNEVFSDLPGLSAGGGSDKPCNMKPYSGTWLYESGIKNDDYPVTLHKARPHTKNDLSIYKRVVKAWNNGHKRLDYSSLPKSLKTRKNLTSFTDRYKVVEGDLNYCHTILAHIAKDGHYYIHPDINQNRSITPREAARLQSFPDDYFFEAEKENSSRDAVFRQIGNAVPVLMAEKIALKLKGGW
ncbi:restriction endonuclease subunit M [Spirochaetia bacterium]|nr:restriction endonuclease subunit M [Spirochaetia bacterium]